VLKHDAGADEVEMPASFGQRVIRPCKAHIGEMGLLGRCDIERRHLGEASRERNAKSPYAAAEIERASSQNRSETARRIVQYLANLEFAHMPELRPMLLEATQPEAVGGKHSEIGLYLAPSPP
jgi:hypothetical protein